MLRCLHDRRSCQSAKPGPPANDGRTETWYALLDVEDGEASAELVREAEVTRLAKGSGQPANGVPA